MPGRDTRAKRSAICPAWSGPRSRSSARISRRVGSAIAVYASLLLNDRPQRLQVLDVPTFLVALEVVGGVGAEALEAVVEQLDVRSVVQRREPDRPERGDGPRVQRVLPVALEADLVLGIEHEHAAAVVPALAVEL